jgi:hypothetical protein
MTHHQCGWSSLLCLLLLLPVRVLKTLAPTYLSIFLSFELCFLVIMVFIETSLDMIHFRIENNLKYLHVYVTKIHIV